MIDFVLIAVVLVAVWSGWRQGFLLGSVNLLVWVGSLLSGFFLYRSLSIPISNVFPSTGVWLFPISFLLAIVLARLFLAYLFNKVLSRTAEHVHKTQVNHVLGIVPGFINGIIYATLLTAVVLGAPLLHSWSTTARESLLVNGLAEKVGWLDQKLSPIFSDAINSTLTRKTVHPKSDETVELNFKVNDARPRPDLENDMLVLINDERTKAGLKPLLTDPDLKPVARAHSDDMLTRGYFSHYTPEKLSPFDRMKKAEVRYRAAGENLAFGQTLKQCHIGLMNSPGHRANILNTAYGRVGIGILDAGSYGLMISQEFRN